VIADLNLGAANATAKEIKAKGGDSFAVAMNVTDEAQVEKGSPTPWPSTARSTPGEQCPASRS